MSFALALLLFYQPVVLVISMVPIPAYVGPTAALKDMVYSSNVDDVPGLNLMIGPSSLGYGLATYLAIDADMDICNVPKGTRICEYGKGRLVCEDKSHGDKTVCYFFDTADAFVFYNDKATPLVDCILDALGEEINADILNNVLVGHRLSSIDDLIQVIPDPLYTDRFYIPSEIEGTEDKINKDCLGVYANDLAYQQGITRNEEDYLNASEGSQGSNILALMWKLVKMDPSAYSRSSGSDNINSISDSSLMILAPKHPVLVTQRSVAFTNKLPMEVGLHYGFKYWQSDITK